MNGAFSTQSRPVQHQQARASGFEMPFTFLVLPRLQGRAAATRASYECSVCPGHTEHLSLALVAAVLPRSRGSTRSVNVEAFGCHAVTGPGMD